MNHNQRPPWPQAEQLDHMATMQDIDFSSFLDIGDIDLSGFPSLDQNNGDGARNPHQPPNTPYHGDAQGFDSHPQIQDFGAEQFELPSAIDQELPSHPGNGAGGENHDFAEPMNTDNWGQQLHQSQESVYQAPQCIPPTPNSYELHGHARRYLQQHMDSHTRTFLEQRYQLKKDDAMAFTPLVSPAVTPQDSHFQNLPEYTIPGAYFSPLTSPALQAQNGSQQQSQQTRPQSQPQSQPQYDHHMQGYYTNPSTAGSSLATSPVDLNMDVDMMNEGLSLPEPARKMRRKAQTPRSSGPSTRVRQSPIVKAQKRKSTTLASIMPAQEVNRTLREVQSQPGSAGLLRNQPFHDSSGTESISPEPLSEAVMGPPPRPASSVHSPALHGQSQSAPASACFNASSVGPATPASLMSLERAQQRNGVHVGNGGSHSAHPLAQSHNDLSTLDEFELPPAARCSDPPVLDRIQTNVPTTSAEATPRLAASRKTPKLGPLSTPASALSSQSAISSPSLSAIISPITASTPGSFTGHKSDRSGKNGKKRGSVGASSVLVSPAIRPKISPSIKPLLPEGASLNESQQALLLASKSNYTHLLEGTLLPGVSYPESLSSGLTSKRTSHKIAEQGRRNRINEALKEMQLLLPKAASRSKNSSGGSSSSKNGAENEEEEEEKDSPATTAEGKSANSKAATVESAIDYIRLLQRERMQTVQVLKEKDDEVAMLRKKLQAAELKLGGSDDNKVMDGEQ
ncbi:hypothetical protein MBLNU459_g4908t1 [Dothideomycetes sp. NU459]